MNVTAQQIELSSATEEVYIATEEVVMDVTGLNVRKPVLGGCDHQKCRPACASAQSDQHLPHLLIGKYYYAREFWCIKV